MRRHWLRRVAAFIVPRVSAVCMEPVALLDEALLDEAVASSALARRSSARTKECHSSINKHYSAAHGCLMGANNRIYASMCVLVLTVARPVRSTFDQSAARTGQIVLASSSSAGNILPVTPWPA